MDTRARILSVDDDDGVRRLVSAALRTEYDVVSAESGEEALALLTQYPDTAVIISDMHMPGIDGITLLQHAHDQSPDVIRVLLTGQPDLETAVAAVNKGQIFRFLTKPVPIADLRQSVEAAVAQYRLVTAERVLLEQTLHGSIRALTDALSLVSPLGFGRATRVKELVTALAPALQIRRAWRVELAAMLSQLATITLPADTLERICYGREISAEEQAMVDKLPALTEQLLGHIPRLEPVRAILRGARHGPATATLTGDDADIAAAAQLLRATLAYDLLHLQGNDAATAIAILRGRPNAYDVRVLDALTKLSGSLAMSQVLVELPLAGLKAGMVLVSDLALNTGMLLVCAGATVTLSLLERLKNLPRGSINEPIRVQTTRALADSGR
jgi:CheY-like chemotaxis protein